MSGVTWRELPADAPELPELAIVRDGDGDLWARIPSGDGDASWIGITGRCTGEAATWRGISECGPMDTPERDDAPWAPPGELVVDDEMRAAQLAVLDAQRRAFEAQAAAWPQIVEHTREVMNLAVPVDYVRVDDEPETEQAKAGESRFRLALARIAGQASRDPDGPSTDAGIARQALAAEASGEVDPQSRDEDGA